MPDREIITADAGKFPADASYIQIVPPPIGTDYLIPEGGLVWHNADNAARTFIIEIRKGDIKIELFNTELAAGEGFAWPFSLNITPSFDGVWGKVTTAPTTQPTWYYHGRPIAIRGSI